MTDQSEKSYELLLKNGHVIDPANQIDRPMDVAIHKGRIAKVAQSISSQEAAQTVDVSGLYVTPGILDIHTHVYQYRFPKEGGITCIDADAHMLA